MTHLISRQPSSPLPISGTVSTIDSTWHELAPPERLNHAAIYDAVHDRMLVFGGFPIFAQSTSTDTWALALGGDQTWSRLTTSGNVTAPWVHLDAFPDSARHRMIVAMGGGVWGVWALDLESGSWTSLVSPGTTTPLFADASAAFDPVHNRLLVFGGFTSDYHQPTVYYNNVWSLTLSSSPTWTLLAPSGTPPAPRSRSTAVYDPNGDRLILFGGRARGVAFNDVWALDASGSQWTQLMPANSGPSPRYASLAALDSHENQIFFFAGTGAPVPPDLWALSLGPEPAWTQILAPDAPTSARDATTLVLDTKRRNLVLYGTNVAANGGYTWSLSLAPGSSWTPSRDAPKGRCEMAAVYDRMGDRMLVYGGFSMEGAVGGESYPFFGDLWAKDLGTGGRWTQIQPGGAGPPPLAWCSGVLDGARHRVIVFGGDADPMNVNDTWELSLDGPSTWTHLSPKGPLPAARWGAAAAFDPVRSQMIIFGGYSDGTTRLTSWNDLWSLSLNGDPTWTQIVADGPPPGPGISRMEYDPIRDRMIVLHGASVWTLTLSDKPTWSMLQTLGSPGWRSEASLVYDPTQDRMIVFGGGDGNGDLWTLSLAGSPQWTQLDPAGTLPSSRWDQAAVYDVRHHRMVMFGGFSPGGGISTNDYSDSWEISSPPPAQPIPAVPTEISIDDAVVESGRVHIRWVSPTQLAAAKIYRAPSTGDWTAIGTVSSDDSGVLRFDDPDVTPGSRYGYRLGVSGLGKEQIYGEVWVTIPIRPTFSLEGLRPNPGSRDAVLSFSLASAAPATVELLDLAGRSIFVHALSNAQPGAQVVRLEDSSSLRPGIYFVRVTQGSQSLTRKAVIVH